MQVCVQRLTVTEYKNYLLDRLEKNPQTEERLQTLDV